MIFPVIFDTSVISAPDSKLSEEWSSFGSRFCHFCPIAALSAPASVIFVISAPPLASPRCAAGEVVCGLMGRIVAMNPCSCQGGTVIVGCILRVVGVGGVYSECRRFGFFDSASLRSDTRMTGGGASPRSEDIFYKESRGYPPGPFQRQGSGRREFLAE